MLLGGGYVEVPNKNINLNDWKDYIFVITSSVTDTNTDSHITNVLFDVNTIIAGNNDYYEITILKNIAVKYDYDTSKDIKTDVSIYADIKDIESINFQFNFHGVLSEHSYNIISIKAIKIK